MKTRPIGTSGIEASVIALGAWGMGGWQWGGADDDESVRAVHAAVDAGITLIDTAPIYGFGRSEEVIGRALAEMGSKRDSVVVATKCGLVCDTRRGEPFFRSDALGAHERGLIRVHKCLHPESVRDEVETSLKRLGVETIDLMQTHWQEETVSRADSMGELMRLKDEGKIRAIGVSNATSAQMAEYRAVGPIDSDQEKYSMLDRGIESDQLPFCREHAMAVLAYSPLALGVLSGKIAPGTAFGAGDIRSTRPRYTPENLARVHAMLDAIRPVAEGRSITIAQLVLAWTVHQPGLTHALVGSRTPAHAIANAEAGSVELTNDELATIDSAVAAYDGV